jgi:hypothetical protein
MENVINKLKILMHKTYAISCRFAEKHAISELKLVKSKLDKMKRKCEML